VRDTHRRVSGIRGNWLRSHISSCVGTCLVNRVSIDIVQMHGIRDYSQRSQALERDDSRSSFFQLVTDRSRSPAIALSTVLDVDSWSRFSSRWTIQDVSTQYLHCHQWRCYARGSRRPRGLRELELDGAASPSRLAASFLFTQGSPDSLHLKSAYRDTQMKQ
jgi:hypothetical protein